MNFKPHLLAKVLAGTKTQTRRPVKAGQDWQEESDRYGEHIRKITTLVWNYDRNRAVYQVGKDYAACPDRSKKQLGRIKIIQIRQEDVRNITLEDALAEGFENRGQFFHVWCGFYDKPAYKKLLEIADFSKEPSFATVGDYRKYIEARPVQLYMAWALTFEIVPPAPGPERGE